MRSHLPVQRRRPTNISNNYTSLKEDGFIWTAKKRRFTGPTPSYSTTDSNKDTVKESSNSSSLEVSDSDPEYVVEDPEIHFDNTNSDTERLNKIVDDMMSTEECKMKLKTKTEIGENQMDKKATDFCQVEDNRTNMNDNGIAKATARAFSEGGSYEWRIYGMNSSFRSQTLRRKICGSRLS
ncbi:hypothetical protein POTOM_054838 [Populus tomentosa]|uniref:Uncharacterized protein n=1 Tax=Populus tomentosa TaxID=118781 RepID=A0A8X8C3J0_POPTO|nr:hypothetical protein POTOM_054838 [Populus tomentosa]